MYFFLSCFLLYSFSFDLALLSFRLFFLHSCLTFLLSLFLLSLFFHSLFPIFYFSFFRHFCLLFTYFFSFISLLLSCFLNFLPFFLTLDFVINEYFHLFLKQQDLKGVLQWRTQFSNAFIATDVTWASSNLSRSNDAEIVSLQHAVLKNIFVVLC